MPGTYSPAALDAAVRKIRTVAAITATEWAVQVQAVMRATAPWTDRNGPSATGLNARQSLETEVGIEPNGNILMVARSTRVTTRAWRGFGGAPVGAFLELGTRRMTRRAVIKPTVEVMASGLVRLIQARLDGL